MSVIDTAIANRMAFLAQLRTNYLRLVGAELGISDLRDVSLREAVAMIEWVPASRGPGSHD